MCGSQVRVGGLQEELLRKFIFVFKVGDQQLSHALLVEYVVCLYNGFF